MPAEPSKPNTQQAAPAASANVAPAVAPSAPATSQSALSQPQAPQSPSLPPQAAQVAGAVSGVAGSLQKMAQPASTQPLNQDMSERLWGALSYIPMLGLLALLVKPTSPYIKLHGRQGLLIFLIFFCTIFLYVIAPPLGAILGGLIQLALFVIGVYSAYLAFMGNWWKIPVLGDIAEKIPVELYTKVAREAITGQAVSADQNTEAQAAEPTPKQDPPAGAAPTG